jgi:hypothetical protein
MTLFTPDELATWETRRRKVKERYRAKEVSWDAITAVETAKVRQRNLPLGKES